MGNRKKFALVLTVWILLLAGVVALPLSDPAEGIAAGIISAVVVQFFPKPNRQQKIIPK